MKVEIIEIIFILGPFAESLQDSIVLFVGNLSMTMYSVKVKGILHKMIYFSHFVFLRSMLAIIGETVNPYITPTILLRSGYMSNNTSGKK